MRGLFILGLVFNAYDENGPRWYKTGPAAYCCALISSLEKKLKKKASYNDQEAIQLAITCFSTDLVIHFESLVFELALVIKEKYELRKLTKEVIEGYLAIIAED